MPQPTPLRPIPSANNGQPARRMFIHDLILDCWIGIHKHERDADQRVRINIDLTVRDLAPVEDSIANVIDYDDLIAGIEAIVNSGHINLVETLADLIGDFCMADSRVTNAKIRVEKLEAFTQAASTGIEIERIASRL
ncbi:MAG: dihydroneopterin aldolase [Alphaproteobacteria bacterium]|jgi:dihydroneopterin aldolase